MLPLCGYMYIYVATPSYTVDLWRSTNFNSTSGSLKKIIVILNIKIMIFTENTLYKQKIN